MTFLLFKETVEVGIQTGAQSDMTKKFPTIRPDANAERTDATKAVGNVSTTSQVNGCKMHPHLNSFYKKKAGNPRPFLSYFDLLCGLNLSFFPLWNSNMQDSVYISCSYFIAFNFAFRQ